MAPCVLIYEDTNIKKKLFKTDNIFKLQCQYLRDNLDLNETQLHPSIAIIQGCIEWRHVCSFTEAP